MIDEDDEDNDFAIDFLEDNAVWEDNEAYRQIAATVPPGWQLVKINNYNYQKLIEIEEYLNTAGHPWRKVRWSNGYCSYSTGVMVEGLIGATKLRLRYGG